MFINAIYSKLITDHQIPYLINFNSELLNYKVS